jgi:iron only hydrogenase large subunit-like protein
MNKMDANYRNIFKTLVKAYFQNNFDETLKNLLSDSNVDKNVLCSIISNLSGVTVSDSETFNEDLKNAIKNYSLLNKQKIVTKIDNCTLDCIDKDGKTPCQKSCPFNAIYLNKEQNCSYIDSEKCTDCGFCIDGCPERKFMDKIEFLPLANLLNSGSPVIAAVAPAISGQFGEGVSLNKLRTAFKKMGFLDMVEVAFFADMLTLKEAVEFDEHVKTEKDLMITSCCCPMWVAMVKRVYNNLVKYVTPSVSPMIAAGKVLKKLNPGCRVVFIGPCVAKKAEAKEKDIAGIIDYVLTFTELKDIFEALEIDLNSLEDDHSVEYSSKGGRLYARTGGVSTAISDAVKAIFPEKHIYLKALQGNGVIECKNLLQKAQTGEIDANFIEGMGCVGGCVGGPKALISKEKGTEFVNSFAEESKYSVATESFVMNNILNTFGINSIDDFKDKEKT